MPQFPENTPPRFDEFFYGRGIYEGNPLKRLYFQTEILKSLTDLLFGRLPDGKQNLMILMPPRLGKTMTVVDFVAYALGCFQDSQFIYTSYSADLAIEQTRTIKTIIQLPWYRDIFHLSLDKESDNHFTTTRGGIVYGTGVGGPLPGRGAGKTRECFGGCIVIDDPIKTDDARSETVLTHVNQWFTGVIQSRRNVEKTPIILIMQPVNPNDLRGFILKTEPELWHIIKFPALLPDGTSIWPEKISLARLNKLKEVDPFTYYAQYQQDPQIEGGNIIKRDWWKFHDAYTEKIEYKVNGLVFITADTAMKVKTMNDFTAMGAWHATQKHLDKLDLERGKYEFPELMRRAMAFWLKWEKMGAQFFAIEDKVSGTSLGQMLAEKGIPVVLWKPGDYEYPDDKVGRVKMTTWYIQAGRVRMPAGRPDISELVIDECSAFSGSDTDTDDIVDEVTMAASIWKSKGGGLDIEVN